MPTKRPRHMVTETVEVAEALDAAGRRWPKEAGGRSRLLLRLIAEGQRAIASEEGAAAKRRTDAVRETAGAFSGLYPPGYLARLREDWPA